MTRWARPPIARSAQILFCSVDSVVLAWFSVLKPLLSVLRVSGEGVCMLKGETGAFHRGHPDDRLTLRPNEEVRFCASSLAPIMPATR
jgi:hypothetical protein